MESAAVFQASLVKDTPLEQTKSAKTKDTNLQRKSYYLAISEDRSLSPDPVEIEVMGKREILLF